MSADLASGLAIGFFLFSLGFWATSRNVLVHQGSAFDRVSAVLGLSVLTALPAWVVLAVGVVLR